MSYPIDVQYLIFEEIEAELFQAERKFPTFNSAHEGFAVLKEEVDELWESVKTKGNPNMREEAIQVAAMAARFIRDICDAKESVK